MHISSFVLRMNSQTIYDECISLLKAKKDKYKNKTLIICRTKADEIIRNKMINSWRKDTGENGNKR